MRKLEIKKKKNENKGNGLLTRSADTVNLSEQVFCFLHASVSVDSERRESRKRHIKLPPTVQSLRSANGSRPAVSIS